MDSSAPPAPAWPPAAPVAPRPSGASRFWLGFGAGCVTSLLLVAALSTASLAAGWAYHTASERAEREAEAAEAAFEEAMAELEGAMEDGDHDRAESIARELVAGAPDEPELRELLWNVRIDRLVAAEDASGASALLAEARAAGIEPDRGTQVSVAELWLAEGEAARALEIAERVAAASTGSDDEERWYRGAALLMRGLARRELGDPQGAVADIREAIGLAPDEDTAEDWRRYLEQAEESAR